MRSTISPGCASFVLIAAFTASRVSAQTGIDQPSPDVRAPQIHQITDSSLAGGPPPAKAEEPSTGPAVISVDILRHPVTPKVRKILMRAIDEIDSGEHELAIAQLLQTLRKYLIRLLTFIICSVLHTSRPTDSRPR